MKYKIKQWEFDDILFKAFYRVYFSELKLRTPGNTSMMADGWDMHKRPDGSIVITHPLGVVMSVLEFGAKPHRICAKNAKSLAFKWGKAPAKFKVSENGKVFMKCVNHPGFKGYRFIQKMLKDPQLKKEFYNYLKSQLKEYLTKK